MKAYSNRKSRWFVVMMVMVLVTAAAAPAGALDVNGRWAGKLVCKVCCSDGYLKFPAKDVVWLIKQTGSNLLLRDDTPFTSPMHFPDDGAIGRVLIDAGKANEGAVTVDFCVPNGFSTAVLHVGPSRGGHFDGFLVQDFEDHVVFCDVDMFRTDATPPTFTAPTCGGGAP